MIASRSRLCWTPPAEPSLGFMCPVRSFNTVCGHHALLVAAYVRDGSAKLTHTPVARRVPVLTVPVPLIVPMILIMTLSLASCGGGEAPAPTTTPDPPSPTARTQLDVTGTSRTTTPAPDSVHPTASIPTPVPTPTPTSPLDMLEPTPGQTPISSTINCEQAFEFLLEIEEDDWSEDSILWISPPQMDNGLLTMSGVWESLRQAPEQSSLWGGEPRTHRGGLNSGVQLWLGEEAHPPKETVKSLEELVSLSQELMRTASTDLRRLYRTKIGVASDILHEWKEFLGPHFLHNIVDGANQPRGAVLPVTDEWFRLDQARSLFASTWDVDGSELHINVEIPNHLKTRDLAVMVFDDDFAPIDVSCVSRP